MEAEQLLALADAVILAQRSRHLSDLETTILPMPQTPITIDEIETLFTTSKLLSAQGTQFERIREEVWQMTRGHDQQLVTFGFNG